MAPAEGSKASPWRKPVQQASPARRTGAISPRPKGSALPRNAAKHRQPTYGTDDPLRLQEPPTGADLTLKLVSDGDNLSPGANPDSLFADVQALLAQEQMLADQ